MHEDELKRIEELERIERKYMVIESDAKAHANDISALAKEYGFPYGCSFIRSVIRHLQIARDNLENTRGGNNE